MTEKLLPPPLKAESKELTFTCDDDLSKKKKETIEFMKSNIEYLKVEFVSDCINTISNITTFDGLDRVLAYVNKSIEEGKSIKQYREKMIEKVVKEMTYLNVSEWLLTPLYTARSIKEIDIAYSKLAILNKEEGLRKEIDEPKMKAIEIIESFHFLNEEVKEKLIERIKSAINKEVVSKVVDDGKLANLQGTKINKTVADSIAILEQLSYLPIELKKGYVEKIKNSATITFVQHLLMKAISENEQFGIELDKFKTIKKIEINMNLDFTVEEKNELIDFINNSTSKQEIDSKIEQMIIAKKIEAIYNSLSENERIELIRLVLKDKKMASYISTSFINRNNCGAVESIRPPIINIKK